MPTSTVEPLSQWTDDGLKIVPNIMEVSILQNLVLATD